MKIKQNRIYSYSLTNDSLNISLGIQNKINITAVECVTIHKILIFSESS